MNQCMKHSVQIFRDGLYNFFETPYTNIESLFDPGKQMPELIKLIWPTKQAAAPSVFVSEANQ